jgi:hypothetical protein
MVKIIMKIGLALCVVSILIILSGMSLNSNSNNRSTNKLDQDSLKTINNYQITLLKDEAIVFNISDMDYFYSMTSSNYKKGENQNVTSNDYNFNFDYSELIKIDKLVTPEELNLHNSQSNSMDLKSLMDFSFSKYSLLSGYEDYSWWRQYVTYNAALTPWNDENPDMYKMETDKNGQRLDDKMMGIFHSLMKNKRAREIIYEAIKQNFNLINPQISVFQKRLLLLDINSLIPFCENYSANRKKYLKGRTSVTEKPGEYSNVVYGYESSNEGFLFRRIEFDGIPPLELVQFLKELQKTILKSLMLSEYNSNMSCEINGGKLKINSYINSKNKIGFMLRANNNYYFVPNNSINITKLESNGKDYWRILFDQGNGFITLDENLNKV